jgi:FdhD protein
MREAAEKWQYREYRNGQWNKIEGGVIVEKPVSLTVNGEIWLTFMCSPLELEALAIGFLFNENIIQSMDEVESVRACPAGDNVDVWLNRSIENPRNWRRTSGCTGGMTTTELPSGEDASVESSADDPSQMNSKNGHISTIKKSFSFAPEAVSVLVDKLFDSQQLYRNVGGVHNSGLSDGTNIVVSAEDIGRHNTLDKIAGRCLLDGIHPKHPVLVTTGRVSSEMMQKAFRIGAEVVVSRTSPSSLSVELADQFGITLIGYARRSRFTVYTHPERILTDPLTPEQLFHQELPQIS